MDLVIVAWKATANHQLATVLPPLVRAVPGAAVSSGLHRVPADASDSLPVISLSSCSLSAGSRIWSAHRRALSKSDLFFATSANAEASALCLGSDRLA